MRTGSRIKSIFKRPWFWLLVMLLGILVLSACRAGQGAIPRGWSGVAIAGDSFFVGSMKGELVAVSITDGKRLWEVPLETSGKTGGSFLSCTPKSTAVAVYGTPAVAEDLVYVGGYNGKIYAFSRQKFREEPRWVYPRQDDVGGAIVGGTVFAQGRLYFGSADGKVYALNAADGFKEWDFETGDKIWSTPATDGDTLYIGSFDKKLYALNANDGNKKWQFETKGAIVATPLIYGKTVYFGSFDRYFYALNVSDGSLRWKFKAENWFWAKPVIRNGVIYASNLDGKVYALDAETGKKRVEFDLGSPISSSPVMVGDKLVVVATEVSKKRSVVYALDTESNRKDVLANLEEKVLAPISAREGKVYLHTEADALYEIDVESGAKRDFKID